MAESTQEPAGPGSEPANGVEAAQERVRPLVSVGFSRFRLVMASFLVGFVAFQMRQTANLWLVYDLTGSTLNLGLLGVFQFAPVLVLGLVGGALADVVDRKTLLLFAMASHLALSVALGMLTLFDLLQVWHIYAVTLFTSAVSVLEGPARMTVIPRIVPRSHLMNAITLNSGTRHGSMLLGPSLGGLVIGLWGPGAAYWLVAALFVPSILLLLPLPSLKPLVTQTVRKMNAAHLLEGWRFVIQTRVILALMALDLAAMFFTYYQVLMPVFAEDILNVGPVGFGLLLSAPAAGFIVGTVALLLANNIRRKGLLVLWTFGSYLVAVAVFAASRNFLLSVVALVVLGGLDGVGAILRQTVLQLMVPDEVRGRASAVLQVSNRGGPSMGFIVLGAMAFWLGAPGAMLTGVVIAGFVLATIVVLRRDVAGYRG